MKIRDTIYYIKQDKWGEFLNKYSEFGFKKDTSIWYPEYIRRDYEDGKYIRISISKPCINMWDGKDKNRQKEIWLWDEDYGRAAKDVTKEYIVDLIEQGFVDE